MNEQLKICFVDKLFNNLSNSIFFFICLFDLWNQEEELIKIEDCMFICSVFCGGFSCGSNNIRSFEFVF